MYIFVYQRQDNVCLIEDLPTFKSSVNCTMYKNRTIIAGLLLFNSRKY